MSRYVTETAVGEMALAYFKGMLEISSKGLQVQPVFELCYELPFSMGQL